MEPLLTESEILLTSAGFVLALTYVAEVPQAAILPAVKRVEDYKPTEDGIRRYRPHSLHCTSR
jgi:hypothetical protein